MLLRIRSISKKTIVVIVTIVFATLLFLPALISLSTHWWYNHNAIKVEIEYKIDDTILLDGSEKDDRVLNQSDNQVYETNEGDHINLI